MGTTVLLLGNGGREHAWAKAIKKSEDCLIVNWAPKVNPGIEDLSIDIIQDSYSATPDLSEYDIDLAIIGPEAPLVIGVTDWLEEQDIRTFGPTKANARLEGSKSYMRQLLTKYEVEGNIKYTVCRSEDEIYDAVQEDHNVAVKPDGLTGGKGVRVAGNHLKDKGEVEAYAKQLLNRDGVVLLEELLTGTEFTLQAFCNGAQMVFLPLVADYKRAYDDDIGPNTGSMGSASLPTHKLPMLSDEDLEKAKSIVSHVVRAASMENGTYVGAVYGQFMLTDDGPKVVEFNARLGDPEAINTLALLDQPVVEVITQLLEDETIPEVTFSEKATCCVYLVPEGYPSDPEPGVFIELDDEIKRIEDKLHYASVERADGGLITTTSRSLAVLGMGNSLDEAYDDAYESIPDIEGLRYRSDIGISF